MLKVSYDYKRRISCNDMYLISRRWHVWKVTDGMTTTLRTHLEDNTPNCILSFMIGSISSMHTTLYQPRHPLSLTISPKKVFVNGSRALLRLMIRYSVHILPLLPLTPIDDTSQLMLLSAKSFENCSRMLGL